MKSFYAAYDRISSLCNNSILYKSIFILFYVLVPPISLLIKKKTICEYFTNYFLEYELFWYLFCALFFIFTYAIKRHAQKTGMVIDAKINTCSLTEVQQNIRFHLFVFITAFLLLYMIISLFSENRLHKDYGSVYPFALFFMQVFIYLTCALNGLYFYFLYRRHLDDTYKQIKTVEELFDSTEIIKVQKSLNVCLYIIYTIVFVIISITYNSKGVLTSIISKLTEGSVQISTEDIYYLITFLSPIAVSIVYYIYFVRSFKRYIFDTIIRLDKERKLTPEEMSKIKFVFFDSKSCYNISGDIKSYISIFVFPIIGFTIQVLAVTLWNAN